MKKLEWLFADENKCDFIQNFIKIADKNGNIVPFVLTHEQRELIEGLDHLNIISKSRQLGVSVCCAALAIRECIVKEHSTNVLISHSQASTNAVFDKLKQMFYSLPEWIRPDLWLTTDRHILLLMAHLSYARQQGTKNCSVVIRLQESYTLLNLLFGRIRTKHCNQ